MKSVSPSSSAPIRMTAIAADHALRLMNIAMMMRGDMQHLVYDYQKLSSPVNPALSMLLLHLVSKAFYISKGSDLYTQLAEMLKNNNPNFLPLIAQYDLPIGKADVLNILAEAEPAEWKSAEDKQTSLESKLTALLWQSTPTGQSLVEDALVADSQSFIRNFWPEGAAWLASPARVALRKLKQIDTRHLKIHPINGKGMGIYPSYLKMRTSDVHLAANLT